jgi:hypothetical protein
MRGWSCNNRKTYVTISRSGCNGSRNNSRKRHKARIDLALFCQYLVIIAQPVLSHRIRFQPYLQLLSLSHTKYSRRIGYCHTEVLILQIAFQWVLSYRVWHLVVSAKYYTSESRAAKTYFSRNRSFPGYSAGEQRLSSAKRLTGTSSRA